MLIIFSSGLISNLEEKKSKLNQLMRTNKRQDEALINLKKQISIDDNKSRNRNNINKE